MTLPLPFVIDDGPIQGNFDAIAMAWPGVMTYGPSPAFTWSGTNRTLVTVTHGLGRTPRVVICGSARFGDAMVDGRAPWATVPGNYTATTFDIAFATHDNAGIGAFGVPAGACDWLAIA